MWTKIVFTIGLVALVVFSCTPEKKEVREPTFEVSQQTVITVKGTDYLESTGEDMESPTTLTPKTWLSYEVEFEVAGRYRTEVSTSFNRDGVVWIEDHIDNPDGRTNDITGKITIGSDGSGSVDGSSFNAGKHKIKLHAIIGEVTVNEIVFTLME
ncbi:MAG: hypothetical protein ACR2MT_11285 [Aurantibacter sp.]